MKRILLIGKRGQIGAELERLMTVHSALLAVDRSQLDLAAPHDIVRVMRDWQPEVVVNAAAYTAVDKAESDQDAAMEINGRAPGILAEECKKLLNCL